LHFKQTKIGIKKYLKEKQKPVMYDTAILTMIQLEIYLYFFF
jgi:hypothetical protein